MDVVDSDENKIEFDESEKVIKLSFSEKHHKRLKLIMNKYLKYKYKYLKLTNKALIYNSLHDKNYNDIYDKYKKYKYKYLQIKN